MASQFDKSMATVADALNPADSPNTQLSKFHEALCKIDPSDYKAAIAAMKYGKDLQTSDGHNVRLWGSSVTGFEENKWLSMVKIDLSDDKKSTHPIVAYLGCEK